MDVIMGTASVSLVQTFTTRFNGLRIPTSVSLVQKFTTRFNRLRIPTSVSLVQKFTTIFNRLRIPKSILHLRVHIAGYISVRKPLRMLNVCIGMVQSCCTHVPNGGILQSDIGVRLLQGNSCSGCKMQVVHVNFTVAMATSWHTRPPDDEIVCMRPYQELEIDVS